MMLVLLCTLAIINISQRSLVRRCALKPRHFHKWIDYPMQMATDTYESTGEKSYVSGNQIWRGWTDIVRMGDRHAI
jgi:hypothetical protein